MGPIAYNLCHKEVIGVAMWITGLCSFPPLITPTDVSLQEPGVVLRKDFNAPLDKSYLLSRPCKTQRHILWQGLRPFFHAVNPREFKILVIET